MNDVLKEIIDPPKRDSYGIGTFYELLHAFYEFFLTANILFCEDVPSLLFLLNITFLNLVGVYIFRRCPLELIVKKYVGDCYSDKMRAFVIELDKTYKCDHVYENHLQLLGTAYAFLSLKIMLLIFYKTWTTKQFMTS